MKYRKKPVVVDAFQYNGNWEQEEAAAPEWARQAFDADTIYCYNYSTIEPYELCIKTLEGNHHVSVGDYIIKGIKGELYSCKPDIFNMTYEMVEDE